MIAFTRIILALITLAGAWFLLNLGLGLHMLSPFVGGLMMIVIAFNIARPVFTQKRGKYVQRS